jgi:uncharacterized protein YjbI with pentapeptide repeats
MSPHQPREQRTSVRPGRPTPITTRTLDRRIREDKPLTDLDLSGFVLAGRDLRRRNLSGSTLSGANLIGANLERARLAGCDLSDAEVHGARLVEADLRRADLSKAVGLTPDQLRGALLESAKLPDGFAFDGLDRVRSLVDRAERQLHVLLLACASVGVVSWGSEHAQLFQGSTPLTLPGLNVPVRLSVFYVFAPLLLFGLYSGLSFTLRKLWYELVNLPAQFPNGRGLHQQSASSTPAFTAPAARHLARRIPEYSAENGERRLTVLLAWWTTPLAMMALVWLPYLARHATWITWWHVFLVLATTAWGIRSYRLMDYILSGRFRRPAGGPRLAQRPHTLPARSRTLLLGPVPVAAAPPARSTAAQSQQAALPTARDKAAPETQAAPASAAPPAPLAAGRRSPQSLRGRVRTRLREAWVGPGLAGSVAMAVSMILLSAIAISGNGCSTARVVASERSLFCNYLAADLAHASLTGLRLPHANLKRAALYSADLEQAQLEEANLRYANLVSARMNGINLKDARLDGAVLWEARLDGARLKEAEMSRADLRGASLRWAQVQGVAFDGANLRGVDWTGALVCGMELRGAAVDTEGLRRARGWNRVVHAPFETGRESMDEFQGQPYPGYLDATEREEYFKWRRAWLATHALPRRDRDAGARLDTAALVGMVEGVDVSMGASRQRDKEQLLAEIRSRGRYSGRVVLTDALLTRIEDFREGVTKKARNHCVDLLVVPASGGDGRPGGAGPAEQ